MSKKGPGGEIEVRNIIRDWWRPVEPDTVFERTPRSGGWHAAAVFRASGDLMCSPGSRFPFSVEVKRQDRPSGGRPWSLERLLSGRQSPVWGWWAQCTRDAGKSNLKPFLWFRKSHMPWITMLRHVDAPAEYRGLVGSMLRCPHSGDKVLIAFYDMLLRVDPRVFLS